MAHRVQRVRWVPLDPKVPQVRKVPLARAHKVQRVTLVRKARPACRALPVSALPVPRVPKVPRVRKALRVPLDHKARLALSPDDLITLYPMSILTSVATTKLPWRRVRYQKPPKSTRLLARHTLWLRVLPLILGNRALMRFRQEPIFTTFTPMSTMVRHRSK